MRRLRTIDLFALAALAVPLPALAQTEAMTTGPTTQDEEGPIIVDREPVREGLHLEPVDLTLDLIATYQHSHVRTGDVAVDTTAYVLTQIMSASTSGYYIHPNFIEYRATVGLGVDEIFSRSDAGSSNDYSAIYNWDVSMTILRNGEWPLNLFSRREHGWIFRDFAGTIQTDTTETGGSVAHQEGPTSTSISYSHVNSKQKGDNDFDTMSYTQDRFSWFTVATLSESQTLEFSYNYNAIQESGFIDYSYQTHEANLTHRARFGESNRSDLTSAVNYNLQSGDTDYERFRWSERLSLQHTDEFRTRYDYSYTHTAVSEVERDVHRGSAGFTHQLYKSLTTTGNVGASRAEGSDDFGSTSYFADINWDYTKQVPYGRFGADLGLGWSRDENDASGKIRIIDLPGAFSGAEPIVIIGANIDPRSIVLTDPSGFVYRPTVDYDVTGFPDHIEISRVIGGRIGDGQSVLIDYSQDPLPANTIDTTSFNTGLRYDIIEGVLGGLSVYGRYTHQEQTIDSPTPGVFTPNQYDDYTYGSEYRINEFTLGAEQQLHDSTVYPYDASRLFARYVHTGPLTTWSLNTAYTSIDYTAEENTTDFYTVSARVEHHFNTHLTGSAVVMWRDERDERTGKSTGFEEQLELNWTNRQLEAYVQVRASQLNSDFEDSRYEFVRVGVRRRF